MCTQYVPCVCCRSLCAGPSSGLLTPSSRSAGCASGIWSWGTADGGSRKTSWQGQPQQTHTFKNKARTGGLIGPVVRETLTLDRWSPEPSSHSCLRYTPSGQDKAGPALYSWSGEATSSALLNRAALHSFTHSISAVLVHVSFLGVDVDHATHHLTPILCVSWHAFRVLIVIRVCLRNGWMNRGIWGKVTQISASSIQSKMKSDYPECAIPASTGVSATSYTLISRTFKPSSCRAWAVVLQKFWRE